MQHDGAAWAWINGRRLCMIHYGILEWHGSLCNRSSKSFKTVGHQQGHVEKTGKFMYTCAPVSMTLVIHFGEVQQCSYRWLTHSIRACWVDSVGWQGTLFHVYKCIKPGWDKPKSTIYFGDNGQQSHGWSCNCCLRGWCGNAWDINSYAEVNRAGPGQHRPQPISIHDAVPVCTPLNPSIG